MQIQCTFAFNFCLLEDCESFFFNPQRDSNFQPFKVSKSTARLRVNGYHNLLTERYTVHERGFCISSFFCVWCIGCLRDDLLRGGLCKVSGQYQLHFLWLRVTHVPPCSASIMVTARCITRTWLNCVREAPLETAIVYGVCFRTVTT